MAKQDYKNWKPITYWKYGIKVNVEVNVKKHWNTVYIKKVIYGVLV